MDGVDGLRRGVNDEMPDMETLAEYKDNPSIMPEELIQGILRRVQKMLISGSFKAVKPFLLMELCTTIAEGIKWLEFNCRKGRVLYGNLEIDPASCINRFLKIYEALGVSMDNTESIVLWNLRGHAVLLDQMVPKLIRRVRDQAFRRYHHRSALQGYHRRRKLSFGYGCLLQPV